MWAAGVTYLRSKTARMEESDFSATAYDRVYDAASGPRFFSSRLRKKSWRPAKPSAFGATPMERARAGARARHQLARAIVGCTIGNDMSSRDIEGENLLYLPQARSTTALRAGSWIGSARQKPMRESGRSAADPRGGETCFAGETRLGKIKRSFEELAGLSLPVAGLSPRAVLLTGTGIVPPDDFTLHEHDVVEIEIAPIGVLRNSVVIV